MKERVGERAAGRPASTVPRDPGAVDERFGRLCRAAIVDDLHFGVDKSQGDADPPQGLEGVPGRGCSKRLVQAGMPSVTRRLSSGKSTPFYDAAERRAAVGRTSRAPPRVGCQQLVAASVGGVRAWLSLTRI